MKKTFQDAKVVVMGLGLHGGGLAMAKWFFSHGAEVIVTDMKSAEQLQASIDQLDDFCRKYRLAHAKKNFHFIEYVLGQHREKDFSSADLVFQNPGVPHDNPFLEIARTHEVPIENELSFLFFLTPKTPKIGITGTRGKSTTTTLVYDILKKHNPDTLLAGNIVTSTSSPIGNILDTAISREKKGEIAPIVLELSSFQLESLEEHQLSPDVASVTNIMPDHLNRYSGMKEYVAAKTNIFRHQDKDQIVILNYDNAGTRAMGESALPGHLVWVSHLKHPTGDGVFIKKEGGSFAVMWKKGARVSEVCRDTDIVLPGEHNLENILMAIAIVKVWGVPNTTIRTVLRKFAGIPHRLEYLTTIKGRKIYNDTASTTPDATMAALKTLNRSGSRRIVLIAGGADKQLTFELLAPIVERSARAVILLSGTATPKLASSLGDAKYSGEVLMANSMREAIEKAWRVGRKDDTILLSPGCASFGMFVNEFDRGAQFKELIVRLTEQEEL